MQKLNFNFDYKKATQALNFLALKAGGQISKIKVLKLIYFADRYHLRKYGRLITNDIYFAMPLGPVPSSVKDLAESSSFLDTIEQKYSRVFIKPKDKKTLISIHEVDRDILSDSEVESLEFSWKVFGSIEPIELAKLTHDYPEWKKRRDALELDPRILINIEDFLEDPDSPADKCFDLSDEDKAARREELSEMSRIEALWS